MKALRLRAPLLWSLTLLSTGMLGGCEGPAGVPGVAGEDGADGREGTDGEDGADGINGVDGAPGAPGLPGVAGVGAPGVSGRDGRETITPTILSTGITRVGDASIVSLSATGHDRLFGVTFDEEGNLFATGQVSADVDAAADFSLLVAKFLPNGELDRRFGNDGVATKNVAIGGTSRELARGVVVQSTGNVVIAGAVEHDPKAPGLLSADTDIVLLRFTIDGVLDPTFGTGGVARIDLNTGVEGTNNNGDPALVGGDSQWALALGPDDRLIVHGTQRAEGFQAADAAAPRIDTDWALLRLTADGALDTTFSGDGKVTLDIGEANASSRGITLLPDGSVVAVGYTTSTALGVSSQQPVLYKVDVNGEFDATFATADAIATPGVWHDFATDPATPALGAEAYGAALQGDKFVTLGYGPTPGAGTATDWISLRFTATGERDLTYGQADGRTFLDPGGFGDNGRFVMVLPDERILGVGVGRRSAAEQPERDAMVAVLSPEGMPDESFAPGGFKLFDVGGDADHFWAGAISPRDASQVAIVGISGGRTTGVNDDGGVLLLLPIE